MEGIVVSVRDQACGDLMGVRILSDRKQDMACLYCSTSDAAFGPVFYKSDDQDAEERAEAFLVWLRVARGVDARVLDDAALNSAVSDWSAQEREQFLANDDMHYEWTCDYCGLESDECKENEPCHTDGHLWHKFSAPLLKCETCGGEPTRKDCGGEPFSGDSCPLCGSGKLQCEKAGAL